MDFKDVVDRIGRPSLKRTIQDYMVSEDQKPYFEQVQQYRDLMIERATLREEMESSLNSSEPLYKHDSYPAYQTCFEEEKRVAENILKDWHNHAPYARLAGIRKDVLEVEAGLRVRLLSDLEHRASIQVQGYMDLVRETRDLWKTIFQTHPGTLASSHELYENYKAQKTERDSLASVFQENPRLYTPFFKVTKDEGGTTRDYWGEEITKENRVYQASIKPHAEVHKRSQMQSLFYERLSTDQKGYYDEVKAYGNARNEAAALYGHLKKGEEVSNSSLTLELFREAQIKRDALALKLVDTPAPYQPFFNLLKVKEDKFLDHAVCGEIREKVQAYTHETDSAKRASQAQELKRILTTSKDYRIFKESGLEANRLSFDIAFHDKLKSGEIAPTLISDQVYKPIQNYLNASKEAACLWKMIQGKEKMPFPEQETYKTAMLVRSEHARVIANDKSTLAIISAMDQGIQGRLLKQAGMTSPEPSHKSQELYPSAAQVLEASRGHIVCLATEFLGSPNAQLSSKTVLRFGSKGSLVVNISDPKAGLWKDFESGEGGNIFHLIQREKGLNYKESVAYLADSLNMTTLRVSNKSTQERTIQPPATPQEQYSLEDLKDRAIRLNAVSELQMKSKPLEGTLAETYLRQIRGITGALASDLRYLPKGSTFMYQGERKTLANHCFAAFGRTQDERLSSVQLTKLDDQGNRALDPQGQKFNKLQYGIAKGSFVCLQEGKQHDRAFIAEGIETALSIKDAGVHGKIIASMGINNISNYQGPEKEIILCGDNDEHKQNSQTHQILENNREAFNTQGKYVFIIKPRNPGEDFNDVLKIQGRKGVQAYVQPYLNSHAEKEAQASLTTSSSKLEAQKINQPMVSSTDRPSNIAIIAKFIEDKMRMIKTYEGSSIAEDAKQELKYYLETFQKNERMLQEFKNQCPDLAKDIQRLYQKQQQQIQEHQRSKGMDM